MGVLDVLDWTYPPRYGPEWGSGGIFGLRYHRGTLYFTLAFEAVSYFVRRDGVRTYDFGLVGPPPRSGGDTYGAVEVVDDFIYFGGWVHAPAHYVGRSGGEGAHISFVNKYSHLHEYSVSEGEVRLVWKEGLGHETDWVGEVSEIIYNPVNDALLLAREDGMVNLGVYEISRDGRRMKRLSGKPALKGSVLYDHACFDVLERWWEGASGIQCVDLVEEKVRGIEFGDIAGRSVDGHGVRWPITGSAGSTHGRFFLFVRGGVFVGNPIDESLEPVTFVRLFDFGRSWYGPRRGFAKPVGGGLLVAFNAYTEALIYPRNKDEEEAWAASNTIVGPSVMVYITPTTARIVAALGARVTGAELLEGKILIATNTMANTGRYDASPFDMGYRGFIALDQGVLNADPPPLTFNLRGDQVGSEAFGGVPLTGYREPEMILKTRRSNKLHIYSYNLTLPLEEAEEDTYTLREGINRIDLSPYRNRIVSFKLEEADPPSKIRIALS